MTKTEKTKAKGAKRVREEIEEEPVVAVVPDSSKEKEEDDEDEEEYLFAERTMKAIAKSQERFEAYLKVDTPPRASAVKQPTAGQSDEERDSGDEGLEEVLHSDLIKKNFMAKFPWHSANNLLPNMMNGGHKFLVEPTMDVEKFDKKNKKEMIDKTSIEYLATVDQQLKSGVSLDQVNSNKKLKVDKHLGKRTLYDDIMDEEEGDMNDENDERKRAYDRRHASDNRQRRAIRRARNVLSQTNPIALTSIPRAPYRPHWRYGYQSPVKESGREEAARARLDQALRVTKALVDKINKD